MDPMDPSFLSRRDFTRAAVAAGTAAAFSWDWLRRDADVMDEALELLEGMGPEWRGLSNHGPMAAEALVKLGRPEVVLDWVRGYRSRLEPFPAPTAKIDPQHWEAALGDARRMGDWKAFFDDQIQQKPWRAVLSEWLPRLAPGLSAVATHGLIRTAHATRSLGVRESKLRKNELCMGLAFWATRYQRLPEAPATASRPKGLPFAEALGKVETYRPKCEAPAGNVMQGLATLQCFPAFSTVADLADVSGDAPRVLSELTACFAGIYLANAQEYTIAFVHSVTAPSALRLLLPHLDPAAARAGLRYGWQAAAGLYTAYANPKNRATLPKSNPAADDLIDRAVASGDEHAIKLTEACLREHTAAPNPIYLAAAADVVGRLRR